MSRLASIAAGVLCLASICTISRADPIWADEFNAPPSRTTYVETLWGMHGYSDEGQYYDWSGVSVNDGILNLTARKESRGGWTYISGQINTGGNLAAGGRVAPGLSFKFGYIEASMKLPAGKGLWPAFWMLPTPNPNYHDGDGEIDIMEFLGDERSIDQMHLHHNGVQGRALDTGTDLTADFHRYGLDWQSDHLTWYLDGRPVYTVTRDVPQVEEYFILNLAVGTRNSWPGEPDASTVFPASFQVDYVRLYNGLPTPEPSSAIIGLGGLLFVLARRRVH